MTAAPTVYGTSARLPRGDYDRGGRVSDDYTCEQVSCYSAQEHDRYRRLYERQAALIDGRACDEFIACLPLLGAHDSIPRFDAVNVRLMAATGWQIVAVPGLIPELAFFTLLATRKFPVTDWIRDETEFDYIVEPDVFHDLFGHVPLLFDQIYADHMQAYGLGGLKAYQLGACEQLARLYWYTIEFGLMRQGDRLRAYGAGILSSPGELVDALKPASLAKTTPLNLLRAMRTRYKIDSYQALYFSVESFKHLHEMTTRDFTPMYTQLQNLPELAADFVIRQVED